MLTVTVDDAVLALLTVGLPVRRFQRATMRALKRARWIGMIQWHGAKQIENMGRGGKVPFPCIISHQHCTLHFALMLFPLLCAAWSIYNGMILCFLLSVSNTESTVN
jgi:hypothetical protein